MKVCVFEGMSVQRYESTKVREYEGMREQRYELTSHPFCIHVMSY